MSRSVLPLGIYGGIVPNINSSIDSFDSLRKSHFQSKFNQICINQQFSSFWNFYVYYVTKTPNSLDKQKIWKQNLITQYIV